MTIVMEDIVAREAKYVLQNYRRNQITFVRGSGVRLYDAEGREYFDLLSGIGVAALGHEDISRLYVSVDDTLGMCCL